MDLALIQIIQRILVLLTIIYDISKYISIKPKSISINPFWTIQTEYIESKHKSILITYNFLKKMIEICILIK